MAGKFKFTEFLNPDEKKAWDLLREKLGGKTIYIPYPDRNLYRETLEKRNQRIYRMYRKFKSMGLSNNVVYAEISIRLSCAKNLSMNRIRTIIKEYKKKEKAA